MEYITDLEIENFGHKLSNMTYDFNLDHDVDIKPIAKYDEHFRYRLNAYQFYANVEREGIKLYEAAHSQRHHSPYKEAENNH